MSFFTKKPVEPEVIKEEPVVVQEPEVVEEPAVVKEEPVKTIRERTTVIGVGTILEGNIETGDNIEINGTMRGNIMSTADVAISGTGFYFGDATMANLNVDGRAEGNIDCQGHTVLTNTGFVKGSVTSSRLTTADGAVIDGTMSLNSKTKAEPVKLEPKKEEPKKEPKKEPKEEPKKEPEEEPLVEEVAQEEEEISNTRTTMDVPEEITRYLNKEKK